MRYSQGISPITLIIVGAFIANGAAQYFNPLSDLNPFGGFPFGFNAFPTQHSAQNVPAETNQFPFPFFGPLNYGPLKAWYDGPNVCKEEKETLGEKIGNNHQINLNSCSVINNRAECTKITNYKGELKTVKTVYKCCQGFDLDLQGRECVRRESISVADQLKRSNHNDFVTQVGENGLMDKLNPKTGSKLTVFVPQRTTKQNDEDLNNVEFSVKDQLENHFVDTIIDITDVDNEMTYNSSNHGSKIRLNIFPGPPGDYLRSGYLYTANCVPILEQNIHADNAVIHVIARPMQPANENLMQLIRQRKDLATFRRILEQSGKDKDLESGDGITVLAPTDEAFADLDPKFRKVLKSGKGCAGNILKNHLMDLTFCSAATVRGARTNAQNLLDEQIVFERVLTDTENIETVTENRSAKLRANSELAEDEADEAETNGGTSTKAPAEETDEESSESGEVIRVNGIATVKEADIMATNGVLYIIDKVLLTESALPVTSILARENATVFKQLIELGDFSEEFNELENVTFYTPVDKAFEGNYWKKQLDEDAASLKKNPDLREFLRNHVVAPMTKTCHLSSGMQKTLNGQDVRVNLYSTQPIFNNVMNRATVNCARLVHFDDESCGSIVHQIDKVIEPPSNNLLQALEANPRYSKFLDYLKAANLTGGLEDTENHMTLLVPTNAILDNVGDWFDHVKSNNQSFELIMGAHILPDVLCCSGIGRSSFPFTKSVATSNGLSLHLNRSIRPVVQNAGLIKCDIMATNGVIHEINDVINVLPQKQPEYDYTLPFPGFSF